MVTTPLPWAGLDNPFGEGFSSDIQPKPPLAQHEAVSSHPCYLGEETDPRVAPLSFQVAAEGAV